MLRLISLIMMIFVGAALSQAVYAPLTKAERKQFLAASKAVETAASDKNYEGIARFGPGILQKYQSVLLDPATRDLRPLYQKIDALIRNVSLSSSMDTFKTSISLALKAKDYPAALAEYDRFFDFLKQLKNDSLLALHKSGYAECMREYFNHVSDLDSFKKLSSLKNADQSYLDSLKKNLELSHRDAFVSISSSNDFNALLEFKKQYPGLYDSEINNLILNHKAKWRLSIKRNPSLDVIERYYVAFPEGDRLVDSVYQKLLYDDFTSKMDSPSAMKYMAHFPDGKYSQEVRIFLDVLEQRQQILMQQRIPMEQQDQPSRSTEQGSMDNGKG